MKTFFFRVCLFLLWIPLFAAPAQLHIADVRRVTERLFSLHIENRALNPIIVRRWFKLYIEQFDPEKSYLLEKEVLPFLQMSDDTVSSVISRIKSEDYSDFRALNQIIQKSITRTQNIRMKMGELETEDLQFLNDSLKISQQRYAVDANELFERQKLKLARFMHAQHEKLDLSSSYRKVKALALFDRKARRLEKMYQADAAQVEHLFVLHMLKSFAKSLDTHTSFFSAEEALEMRLNLEKQFEGVGVVLSENIEGVVIADLVKNSPAEQSQQIKVNDLLVEIDGVWVEALPFEEILALLKNRDRKDIILGVKRLNPDSSVSLIRVTLQKRPIVMNEARITTSVEPVERGVIGKISLFSFYEGGDGMSSERDLKEAIRSFQKQGNLRGLVLDLRENSGGFLRQAVKVAGLFLSNGVVAISKYGKGEVHYLRNVVERRFFDGPVVVLISKMSASASEIVAQALQDYGVGVIVGDERSFGKGSIQYQTVTDEKADLFFKVTVGKYYTPSGKTTQIEGVKTDIIVPTFYAPYNIGERYLEYPLARDRVAPAFIDSLADLDLQTKQLFQQKYLPNLQRPVSFWKNMLPILRNKSEQRLMQNPEFQELFRAQKEIRARSRFLPPNSIDEMPYAERDLQMIEAVNILKDMLLLQQERSEYAQPMFEDTGS
jgi:carboxyl-terminal processing protease